ncbi:hypothetical protein CHS0354_003799 [Potamilus streckersoni]|uniref:Tyrosine-protein kinase ephrin type A/B receptor-like domain-containing protein n=1 Tax=Potamilus streckersoni TaxID=2493646 RepID=A0AAE0T2D3_9BIVA|nr:hypothetical protein CHS0354_003799 [Potamilus streckersoni]
MITTSTTITYETLPCSASSLTETTISEKLQSLQCVSNNTCNLTLSTSCSINGTGTATIALTSSLRGTENLDLPALYKNNTVSDNLMKLVQAITELELSTQKLVNETAADLSVQVYNNTHRVDVKNIGTKAIVDCPTGLVASSGMCVECPLGTYYDSSTSSCHICDLGTYQNESAQSACKPCLAGYTTVGEGSVSVQDCIASSSIQTTQKSTTKASTLTTVINATNPHSTSGNTTATNFIEHNSTSASTAANNLGTSEPMAKDDFPVIIGCSVAVFVVLASGVAGVSIYKWKYRTSTRKSLNGSRWSFNQIRPDTPLSTGSSTILSSDAVNNGHFLPNGQLPPIASTAPKTHFLTALPPLRQ